MSEQKFNLGLTIEETNLVLTALGNLPFKQVFGLMQKIQEEANRQLSPGPEAGTVSAEGAGSQEEAVAKPANRKLRDAA